LAKPVNRLIHGNAVSQEILMITDTSLTPERVKARFSLTFRPKPERIGDESLILKVSLFVLTTSGGRCSRQALENPT